MLGLIGFIVLLSVIVIVHEFGHLVVAKLFNVYCSEFSIGMGKKLCSKKIGETEYSIRMLPIGGFVSMAGDSENALETTCDVQVPSERTLNGVNRFKRILIMFAGPFVNFILAFVIVYGIILSNTAYPTPVLPVVSEVKVDSPADLAGFQKDDLILEIEMSDGRVIKPKTFDDMVILTYGNQDPLTYKVQRGDEILSLNVVPVFDEEQNDYKIGIYAPSVELVETHVLNSASFALDYMVQNVRYIFISLGQLFKGQGLENLSGPVGIYTVTSEAVSMGFKSFLSLIAMLSLNVGIFNLLPLPILDGGRIFLTIIEAIIRRPISEKVVNVIMTLSMLILLGLLIFTTTHDIMRLF